VSTAFSHVQPFAPVIWPNVVILMLVLLSFWCSSTLSFTGVASDVSVVQHVGGGAA
jgi:hypothetical protein